MCTVNIYEAKTNLSKYIDMLESGKENEIILARRGQKVAKIILFEEEEALPRLGCGKGILKDVPFVLKSPEFDDITEEFGL